jgi:hypothetical protein
MTSARRLCVDVVRRLAIAMTILSFSNCSSPYTCTANGKTYTQGQTMTDGCYTCRCEPGLSLHCQSTCADAAVEGGNDSPDGVAVADVPTDGATDHLADDDIANRQDASPDVDAEPADKEPKNDAEAGMSACGGENQPCCPFGSGMPDCISASLACDSFGSIGSICRTCGGTGQPCCNTQVCNMPTDGCGGNPFRCSHCGGLNEPCCGPGSYATRTCDVGSCHMSDVGAQCGSL